MSAADIFDAIGQGCSSITPPPRHPPSAVIPAREVLSMDLYQAGFQWHHAAVAVCKALREDASWWEVKALLQAEAMAKARVEVQLGFVSDRGAP